jgi:hypothetical protein
MTVKRGRPRKNADLEDILENIEETDEVIDETINEIKSPTNISDIGTNGTNGGYNPLLENVIERDYSTPQVALGDVSDIDEPSFLPPSYEDIIADRQQEQINNEPSILDNSNSAYNELEDKDKRIATESLVDTVLDAYEQLHKYAEYVIKVDEDELMQKQAEGKLDLNVELPVSENGDTMTLGEFVAQYNEQATTVIKYDKEFGIKVRPAMIRVFLKRGWGMSDEQFLLYMFGKDIAVKSGMMYSLKKTINNTLATMEKIYSREKKSSNFINRESQVKYEEEEENEVKYDDDILDTYVDSDDIEILDVADNFSTNMNINMPHNPIDPMSGHPKEIKNELRKEKKGKNE